jgi:tetratricopeptide (TPR) repeat protein
MASYGSNAMLVAAREERGWSQLRLAAELQKQGRSEGHELASMSSLRVMISRWENGHQQPDGFHRKLLGKVFGEVDLMLGFEAPDTLVAPPGAGRPDVQRREFARLAGYTIFAMGESLTFESLMPTFELTNPKELRRALGMPNVGESQIRRLERAADHYGEIYFTSHLEDIAPRLGGHYYATVNLLRQSQAAHRTRLLAVVARLGGLMGCLAFDVSQYDLAHEYFDASIEAANQATNARLGAYLVVARSRLAYYEDDYRELVDHARRALALGGKQVSPRLCSWLFSTEAHGQAGLGDVVGTEEALAHAERAFERSQDSHTEVDTKHFSYDHLKANAGTCYVLLGKPSPAISSIGEALSLAKPSEVRFSVTTEMDLAIALLQTGEVAEARETARSALNMGNASLVTPVVKRARMFKRMLASMR